MVQNLAEIGIDARIAGVDSSVWGKRVWGSRPSDMQMIVHNYSGYSHPLITAHWWAPEVTGFTAGFVPEDKAYLDALNAAMTVGPGDDGQALQFLYSELNRRAVKVPLCTFSETVAWRSDRVAMSPSGREHQNDVLEGIETFAIKT